MTYREGESGDGRSSAIPYMLKAYCCLSISYILNLYVA